VFVTEGIHHNSGTWEREDETKQRPYEDDTGPQTNYKEGDAVWMFQTRRSKGLSQEIPGFRPGTRDDQL